MADPEEYTTSGKSPAFQFYPNDFLADAHVIGMSLPERGAYITLLCLCWQQGTLSSDLGRLARLCGIPMTAFKRLWPALEPCFLVDKDHPDRLIHPRLQREREKQADYRRRQSDKGKASGRARNRTPTEHEPEANRGSAPVQPMPVQPDTKSSSSVCDLQSSSADSSQTEARSKRPVFKGQRLVVFEWMLDDLRRLLGSHFDAFDLHEWFYTLDAQVTEAALVIPQRDGGKWLQEQTMAEAMRRGLPVAAVMAGSGKTAGNAAAIARFIARGKS